ncbi:MAG: hypothetical protein A2X19_10100 [Bacteroidetes bacterium GWE2_39_28]|nr:MAG: hypothetical protein A2X19_10100 [Bacteroidetes bacterium GWE2_39_28]OFZ08390.1 MAG: hypothetical protein A2322_04225 [Bacteroidetes bacterium RIFOXYB2_FULL_39_7]OFZ09753.1 MAG: hypothetical protein A2465_03145 [Bacteroidetes bacterium RIFOXYC2_FULL_39_11]HCT94985.1 hypothetical protein [Rikenellaceae bacterium]HCV15908.1 hypothetical protein [Rikenellaceae bacterium]
MILKVILFFYFKIMSIRQINNHIQNSLSVIIENEFDIRHIFNALQKNLNLLNLESLKNDNFVRISIKK